MVAAFRFSLRNPWAYLCVGLLVLGIVRISGQQYQFDDAFNFQPSVSLAKEGKYLTFSLPRVVHSQEITTNGPIQFVMALAIKLFGLEAARIVVLSGIFAALLLSLGAFSPFVAFVMGALFFIWPKYNYCLFHFVGEITAIVFCLSAVRFLHAQVIFRKMRGFHVAGILFGMAIATKMIVFILVPFLLVVMSPHIAEERRESELSNRALIGCYFIALIFFAGFYYFTVAQTYFVLHFFPEPAGTLGKWEGLNSFVRSHFAQQTQAEPRGFAIADFFFWNPLFFCFFVSCAPVSFYRYKQSAYLWLGFLAAFLGTMLNERRLLPFLFFLIFIGTLSVAQLFRDAWPRKWKLPEVALVLLFFAGLAAGIWGGRDEAFRQFQTAPGKLDPQNKNSYGEILPAVKNCPFPIITSGWWRFPELSLLTGVHFYDRLNPLNKNLAKNHEKLFLLIDRSAAALSPYTNENYCVPPVIRHGDFTFCEFDKKIPIGFVFARPGPDVRAR